MQHYRSNERLGTALTQLMRKSGQLSHDYEYESQEFGGKPTEEHVVPLKCIIARLKDLRWDAGETDIQKLRLFLQQHLVIARVPLTLNAKLKSHEMPDDAKWRCRVGDNFSKKQKNEALWARYRDPALKLAMHWQRNANFKQREKCV